MGEQPSYGVAGAGADGLGGLTWDPGPQASGRNPGVSRDSQVALGPRCWMVSIFVTHVLEKHLFLPGTLLFWGHEMVQNSVLAALLDF